MGIVSDHEIPFRTQPDPRKLITLINIYNQPLYVAEKLVSILAPQPPSYNPFTMARDLYFTRYEPSSPPPSPPASEPTNTLAVTSLPRSFFEPVIMNMLRDHFASYGEINQWVPLPGFGRIIIVYESEHDAETVKRHCDPIVLDDNLNQ
jgi:hypothetical protein